MDQKLQTTIHLALSACSEAYNLAAKVEAENAHYKNNATVLAGHVLAAREKAEHDKERIADLEAALREVLAYVDHEAGGTEEIVMPYFKRFREISKICQAWLDMPS